MNEMVSEECVIVRIEQGKVVDKEVVKGEIKDVVRNFAKKLLDEWDVETSDFIVLRDNYTISLKVPISKEIFEKLRKYNIRRVGDKAEAIIPIYEITYSNRWTEETFQTDKFIVILPYINDKITDEVINAVIQTLSQEEEAETFEE